MTRDQVIAKIARASEALGEITDLRAADVADLDLKQTVPALRDLADSLGNAARRFREVEGEIRRAIERLDGSGPGTVH